ncbi:MAG TPA: cysteine desulfurase [Bryobacteraceae bacterium]|nr:cysteine desulfurase [Bryobacteraceae bacterium]
MSTAIETLGDVLDVERIREDFPILTRKIHGKPLVYFDNAATSQKPRQVIDAITRYYTESCANIHRGVHQLSEISTLDYEQTRVKVKRFINAADAHEIVLVRGASEAINLVANTFGRQRVGEGDEVLISALEHHSNIVPWQMLCREKGARLRVVPMNDAGELLQAEYRKLLNARTRIVALGHVSNALGTVNPIGEMIREAHRLGIPVLVDGAQAVPHMKVDVRALDADFYCFSGHKMAGPTGVGVLYGKKSLLEEMPPWQGGGDMIRTVRFEETTYNDVPYKFEAGTPNIAGGIGLGAAVDYLESIGMDRIQGWEQQLLAHGTELLSRIPGVRILGTAKEKAGVLSFLIEGVHPHDVGTILDQDGIAVRTGHHCAQPVMDRLGVPATTRASLAFYNTFAELDALAAGIVKVKEIFA